MPRLYLTIAGISQLAALTMAMIFFSFGLGSAHIAGSGLFVSPNGWTLILGAPTGVAAACLFKARKIGIIISFAVVPALAFALGMSVFSMVGQQGTDMLDKAVIDLAIASVLSILGPLLLGWKKMRWKTKRKTHGYAARSAASN